jgi:hypothetical protein
MRKGIFCVIVCMLMILSSVVPISGTIGKKESSRPVIKGNEQYTETEKIFNDLRVKLDKATTKQEALVLVNEAIVELNEHGLLPKGMTVKRAQRLVTGCFSKSDLAQPFQSNNENNKGNTNCLVVGIATQTYFDPFLILVDIPILYNLVFNSNLSKYLKFLTLFPIIHISQPFKFGTPAYVGGRYKSVVDGNITDKIYSSAGLVWTIGSNGIKKWNGSFYGGLCTKYDKAMYENNSYELWDPVGIRGFVGINFFNFVTFFSGSEFPSFYIGFAREVNFTYSPPWT